MALGAAWSVPVIMVATAAPAAAASGDAGGPGAPATATRGSAVDGNRQVTFILSFKPTPCGTITSVVDHLDRRLGRALVGAAHGRP